MFKKAVVLSMVFSLFPGYAVAADGAEVNELIRIITPEISGNRARDYTMRLWQYDKWSTLPMWQKSVKEIQTIMQERGFDEVEILETPADGVTKSGDWVNPVGWDVKQATLEVIEPPNLPDEYRYLCDYRDNPTSLQCWSAPTPPDGIETELVLMETPDPEELGRLNARGKIVLVAPGTGYGYTRSIKRYLDKYGIPGYLADSMEDVNQDFVTENHWFNGWSDLPGGWWMTAYDSKNNFCFSISQKKAQYLRDILRQGITVRVRAKIDSRYYTDDTLHYITGIVRGSGIEGEEVFINGHINEWGANDNATGTSAILEAVGTLNDLIKSGSLPRPKRSIRVEFGAELYGSLPYVERFLERFRNKTIAAVCCDTGAENYDFATTAISIALNPNCCPSFTDAVFPEIVRLYYSRYAPNRLWRTRPYRMGTDTYFCEPIIGVPTNQISMNNGGHLHHNSMDTIDKVDPRSLRELSTLNAVYLYYMANAGYDEVPWIANLTFDRGIKVVLEKCSQSTEKIVGSRDGQSLGEALSEGLEQIVYYSDLQKKALASIERIVPADKQIEVRKFLSSYERSLEEFGKNIAKQLGNVAKDRAGAESLKITMPEKKDGDWEKEAATIIPKRKYFGTLFLADIPPEEWVEVKSSPHFWSATNWAAASYWWCDGKRTLNQIKELCELEAGVPVKNFDLIKYYRFLEKYDLVEFMKK